jgi:hypothetical protein
VNQLKGRGGDENDDHQCELQKSVHEQRSFDSISQLAANPASDSESSEEASEYRGNCLRRITENEHKLTRPYHFEDQAGRARKRKDSKE